ncbi:hypothetical protein [Intestinibacter sp.]
MLVNLIEVKTTEKEALKDLLTKIPLLSKVTQFNKRVNDINLRYIEYKILKYKINSYENGFLRSDYRIVVLNTYTGHIKFVDEVPITVKKYIARDCVQKSKLNEYILKNKLKNQIERHCKKYENEKLILDEVVSIYKPFWTCKYNGRKIFLDA